MKLLKGKIIWNSADAPFTMPLDLYCVTHVHGKMILEVTLNFEEAQNKFFCFFILKPVFEVKMNKISSVHFYAFLTRPVLPLIYDFVTYISLF